MKQRDYLRKWDSDGCVCRIIEVWRGHYGQHHHNHVCGHLGFYGLLGQKTSQKRRIKTAAKSTWISGCLTDFPLDVCVWGVMIHHTFFLRGIQAKIKPKPWFRFGLCHVAQQTGLYRSVVALTCTDANRLFDAGNKDFAITNFARMSGLYDGFNCLFYQSIWQHQFQFDFW